MYLYNILVKTNARSLIEGTLAVCNTIYRFVWCKNYFILKAYSMVTVVHKKDIFEYAHYAISIKRWLVQSILLILMVFKQLCGLNIGPVILKKRFLKFSNAFSLFSASSTLEKGTRSFFWSNLNPLHLGTLYANVFIEIGPLVLEKTTFKGCQCIFTILPLSLLGEEHRTNFGQHLDKIESPVPKDTLRFVLWKLTQ